MLRSAIFFAHHVCWFPFTLLMSRLNMVFCHALRFNHIFQSAHVLVPPRSPSASTPLHAPLLTLATPALPQSFFSFSDMHIVSSFPEFVQGTTPFSPPQTSYFIKQPPPVVYQASTSEGVHMIIQLTAPAAAALTAHKGVLTSALHLALRRFDLHKLTVYDEDEGRMVAVTLPPAALAAATLSANGILHVYVKCKFMPVSTAFGEAPLVYAILIKPVDELVVSAPFAARSKVPKAAAPRLLPKASKVRVVPVFS